MNILLADRNPRDFSALLPLMAGWNHHLMLAGNGPEARQRLVQENPPDLILADRELPDLDGLALCRWVRAHLRCKPPRVVILSRPGGEMLERAARAAGADALLLKPYGFDQIREQFALAEIDLRRNAFILQRRFARTLSMAAAS